MKNIVISGVIVLVVALLTPQIVQAQGTIYLSNLGQPSAGSLAVGSDSWQAAIFTTGTNADGYVLNSIQLAMTDAFGTPNGFTVMLCGVGNQPGGPVPEAASALLVVLPIQQPAAFLLTPLFQTSRYYHTNIISLC